MSFTINTNRFALGNQRQLNKSQDGLQKISQKLSSGKRINNAADDASGLALAKALEADNAGYSMAMRNSSDALSMLAIGAAAQQTQGDTLIRMRELAAQASNGTLSDAQRQAINQEYQALGAEIDRIAQTTEFNGQPISGTTTLQTGIDGSPNSQTEVTISETNTSSLGLASTDLSTQAGAQAALDSTEAAIGTLAANQAEIGATEARLGTVISNLSTQRLTGREAQSRIEDADMASVTADRAKAQIMVQVGVSMQAHANLQPENVLKLLQS